VDSVARNSTGTKLRARLSTVTPSGAVSVRMASPGRGVTWPNGEQK
jgi:hypothetical protein